MSDAHDATGGSGDAGSGGESGGPPDATGVVTVFLRHGSAVLLFRRSDAVGSYPGRWGAVAGHAEGDPERLARVEVREEAGIDPDTLSFVRRGPPFPVADPDHGTWRVHPFLFDCPTRAVTTDHEWVHPTAVLDRGTVPRLWESYRRVAPTVADVRADREHGAEYVSRRAVEVLRDAAASLAAGVDPPAALPDDERGVPVADDGAGDAARLAALADDLLAARGSMVVVGNRVRRTMADAVERERDGAEDDDGPPAAASVRRAAEALLDGLDDATVEPVDALRGATVATLSRSGTVRAVLGACDPVEVVVAESRPGGEGRAVARSLAVDLDATVTLCADAGLAHALDARGVDAVLVGADTVLADGRVVNKVGTRTLATVAARAGVPVFVATHSDKVAPPGHEPDLEPRELAELTGDGPPDGVTALNPTFDVTPAALVDRYLTERGPVAPDAVRAVAERAGRRADRSPT